MRSKRFAEFYDETIRDDVSVFRMMFTRHDGQMNEIVLALGITRRRFFKLIHKLGLKAEWDSKKCKGRKPIDIGDWPFEETKKEGD